jgi:DNA polymerase-3 subunit epsilon
MDFVAIDFETANEDFASICQVGIASFSQGQLAESWCSLVNPEDNFSPLNIAVHGIYASDVQDSPTWENIFPVVAHRLRDKVVICHTPFDRLALSRACERYDLAVCSCTWLDSARVTRRAWPQFAKSGYGLSNIASFLGITYQAHDALEDARCAGLVVLRAISETGIGLDEWLIRAIKPIQSHARPQAEGHEPNPNGALFGEVLVFTGELSLPRREAAYTAAVAGCKVDDSVTKHTTLLVVGDQDIRRLAGQDKSAKHRKAEELIARGQPIRIVGESEFIRIIG